MTREEARQRIKILSAGLRDEDSVEYAVFDDKEALEMAISALSENKGEWIPVSERLPEEENKRYWICTDCGYQCECRWTNVNPIWTYLTTDWHWNIMDVPQYSKVVAWMPLPEPYKKGGE